MERESFEFRRRIDGLVYRFTHLAGQGKAAIYERSDQMVRMTHDARFGWSIWSGEGALLSRAWDLRPEAQSDHPPDGIWVSRKGDKSYVYELVYVNTPG